jgi:hypothetical protein
MIWIVKNLWLIPALPLLAAGIIAVNKQPARKLAATLAIGSMAWASCSRSARLRHARPSRRGRVPRSVQLSTGFNSAASGWTSAGCSTRSRPSCW